MKGARAGIWGIKYPSPALHSVMEQQLLRRLPQWYYDISPNDYYLVLTNDMDSYYSCRILEKCTGIRVGGFYSFDGGLYLNRDNTKNKEPIFVDLSVTRGKSFDNHYTFIYNPESVNPNVIKQPYFRKFNGGTLSLIAVLYDDFVAYSEYQWETILAIDSFYYGYYNKDGAFRDINIYWYDMLGITDYVVPILERKTADDFSRFIEQEGIKEQIDINGDGELVCHRHIKLPPERFELIRPIKKRFMPKQEAVAIYENQRDEIIVSSEIYSGKYVLNLKTKNAVEHNNRQLRTLTA